MPKVIVYRYRKYDPEKGRKEVGARLAAVEQIDRIGAELIQESGLEIDSSFLDPGRLDG